VTSSELMRSRWRGQRGRLEVWYTTLTDPASGAGVWLHHELVAPTGREAPYAHGWAALFPPFGAPVMARFGPSPWATPPADAVFTADGVLLTPDRLTGKVDGASWTLTATGGGEPLYTFPSWAWRREMLPAAQIVPAPAATFSGIVHIGDIVLPLTDAPGATARIYGHGNARRWGWLHADLGGGDLLEIVAAVSMRLGLRRLPPLPFVKLRLDGVDWPAGDPLSAARSFKATLPAAVGGNLQWTVTGRSAGRRLTVEVDQPANRTLAVDYRDPDGAPAVCHNTERANAVVTLERAQGRAWTVERRWELPGTAHSEIGLRP